MRQNTRYVLLVDDEQNILNALGRELRKWATERSLEILTATSAREGMKTLSACGSLTLIGDVAGRGVKASLVSRMIIMFFAGVLDHWHILEAALAESGSKDFTDDVTIVTARIR